MARAQFSPSGLRFETKSDGTPVTVADRDIERFLRDRIIGAFSEDAVLGEEFGSQPGSSGWRWVIDPIDGTSALVHGLPLFGTLIGIERDGQPCIGVVCLPILNETYWAAPGVGAMGQIGDDQPKPVRVSPIKALDEALVCVTSPRLLLAHQPQAALRLMSSGKSCRGWGDCVGHMMVASGRAEIAVDTPMSPWDACALIPIVEHAGGTITGWDGSRCPDGARGAVSSNTHLHSAALELLRAE